MTRPLSRHNPLRAHARAAWMAAFEKALVDRIPSVRGRVDWDTATYLYGRGLRVVDAVDRYERSYTADLAEDLADARARENGERL